MITFKGNLYHGVETMYNMDENDTTKRNISGNNVDNLHLMTLDIKSLQAESETFGNEVRNTFV